MSSSSVLEKQSVDGILSEQDRDFTSVNLIDFPIPTSKNENWRFTPLRKLRHLHDISADHIIASDYGRVQYTIDPHSQAGKDFQFTEYERGYTKFGTAGYPIDRVSALAFHYFHIGAELTINSSAIMTEPIQLSISTESTGNSLAHTLIHLGKFAVATVVIRYQGIGALADNLEFIVEDGAQLNIIILEEQARDAVHIGAQYIRLARDAAVQSFLIQTGSELSRISTQVSYSGTNATAQLYGLYIAGSGQFFEQRVKVDHSMPQCTSQVHYKGVLYANDDETQDSPTTQLAAAHTVWVGDVLIRSTAQGTSTYEVNRNLLLNPGTRADSVPNLEIETGDIIGAGHASTVSKFDDDQLFYLLSRGIPEKEAKKLVVRGFFAEILHRIPAAEVIESLEKYIEQVLAQAGV